VRILPSNEHNFVFIRIQLGEVVIGCSPAAEPWIKAIVRNHSPNREVVMGRGILLWLLGVPIPIIILLALIWH
jgi:hypothetical protein